MSTGIKCQCGHDLAVHRFNLPLVPQPILQDEGCDQCSCREFNEAKRINLDNPDLTAGR